MAEFVKATFAGVEIDVEVGTPLHKKMISALADAEEAKWAEYRTSANQKLNASIDEIESGFDENEISAMTKQTLVINFNGGICEKLLVPANRVKIMERGNRNSS